MITEDQLEQLAFGWFSDTGRKTAQSADLAAEGKAPERSDFRTVVLKARLRVALQQLNRTLPQWAVEEVVHVVTIATETSLTRRNRAFHGMIMDGVKVEFTNARGENETDRAQLIEFQNPATGRGSRHG